MVDVGQLALIDLLALDIPMILLSAFLLVVTYRIGRFQKGYGIHLIIFRGILAVGYVFLFMGAVGTLRDLFGFAGHADLAAYAETVNHVVELVAVAVVAYSFVQYYGVLKASETQGSGNPPA